ncbi:hypothetical protein QAD02_022750 [Eretmocerus hayati]|uniref:Uncharacterized protein n=1 Tax=Eretmocerus hayati TaxID=131215 RepID=A0ACC2PVJ5_9HYME|nr:hypothetical protein QAD02_022750 [Eretmocerus hayati]
MGISYRPQLLGDSRLDFAVDHVKTETNNSPKRSSRRRPRRTATVDELLREMKLRHGGVLSDNEIEAIERTGQTDAAHATQTHDNSEVTHASRENPEVRNCNGPKSSAAGDCGFAKSSYVNARLGKSATDRSNIPLKERRDQHSPELWSVVDSAVTATAVDKNLGCVREADKTPIVPKIEGLGSDNSARDQDCATCDDNTTDRHRQLSPSDQDVRASFDKWRHSSRRNSKLLCAGDSAANNKVRVSNFTHACLQTCSHVSQNKV